MISVPMNRARAVRRRAAGMLALSRAGMPAAGFEGLDVVWALTGPGSGRWPPAGPALQSLKVVAQPQLPEASDVEVRT